MPCSGRAPVELPRRLASHEGPACGPPNVTLMSDDDEADGARLKADAADGVAEDDGDGARLKADAADGARLKAMLRGGRPSSGDGCFRLRMEGSGRR